MARALSVSRVTVPPAHEPEYLRVLGELARLSEARGRRLWVFRARGRSGSFLECSESRTVESHRTNLMQKLNLHNTAEIVLYAVRKNIIVP